MNCRDVRSHLSAFHDHELGRSESEAVRAHLLDCAGCRREASALRAISGWLEPADVPQVSEGFTDAVMARLRSGEAAVPRGAEVERMARALRWMAIAALAILAVGALFLAMPQSLTSFTGGTLDAASSSDVDREIERNNALAHDGGPGVAVPASKPAANRAR
jgi:anti-sigma factor RsiW